MLGCRRRGRWGVVKGEKNVLDCRRRGRRGAIKGEKRGKVRLKLLDEVENEGEERSCKKKGGKWGNMEVELDTDKEI